MRSPIPPSSTVIKPPPSLPSLTRHPAVSARHAHSHTISEHRNQARTGPVAKHLQTHHKLSSGNLCMGLFVYQAYNLRLIPASMALYLRAWLYPACPCVHAWHMCNLAPQFFSSCNDVHASVCVCVLVSAFVYLFPSLAPPVSVSAPVIASVIPGSKLVFSP